LKHFLLYSFKVLGLALLLAEGLSFFLMHQLANANFYKTGVANRQKGTTYDYVVLGSSRALTTIDTRQIDDSLGTQGYNFSLDDTGVETHELMVKHLLASGIRFRTLVMAFEGMVKSGNSSTAPAKTINDNDHRFLPFIERDYVHQYFRDRHAAGGRKYTASRYFPFIALGYFNVELLWPSLYATVKKDYYYRSDAWGNFGYPMASLEDVTAREADSALLDLENHYLQNIRNICRNQGIRLVVYYSPFYKRKLKAKGSSSTPANERFLNYADLLQDPALFYDRQHVNARGRAAVTAQLVKDARDWLKG
jgi:hypothetical protein